MQEPNMSKFITELQVSQNKSDEDRLTKEHFTKIPNALIEGPKGKSYLWYKKGLSPAVTRIQFSFDSHTSGGLQDAKYQLIKENLNEGKGGDPVHLWYKIDPSECENKITDLHVTTNPTDGGEMMQYGWEPMTCEVSWWWLQGWLWWSHRVQHSDKWMHLWVKREKPTYIKKIEATKNVTKENQLFKDGYIRLDENINRGTDGEPIFIWYSLTTDPAEAIRDLKVSTNDIQAKKYHGYEQVKQDLNEGTGGNEVHLFYKKDIKKNPIQSLILLSNPAAVEKFQTAGVTVINKNLNSGNGSAQTLLLAFYQQIQL